MMLDFPAAPKLLRSSSYELNDAPHVVYLTVTPPSERFLISKLPISLCVHNGFASELEGGEVKERHFPYPSYLTVPVLPLSSLDLIPSFRISMLCA